MQTAVTPPWIWLLVIVVVIVVPLIVFVRKRSRTPSSGPTPIATKEETKVVERTVEKIVLVVCPYCGAKNEQGMTKCQSCQGDI
ncbi:MAG: hypothetical protein ACFFF4_05210 [Candidatus Thorarchaeota archaeon]